MVLAIVIQCVLISCFTPEPNAADAWREFFKQIQDIEIPQGRHSQWTAMEQAQYEKFAPLIKQARELALNRNCNWNVDYSQGLYSEMKHHLPLREAAQLIHFSMQGDEEAGNTASALAGMQSLLGITRQYNAKSTLINALVTSSTFAMTTSSDSLPLIDATTDPVQLEVIYQMVSEFDSFDPFGFRASIGFERDMMLQWLASDNAMNELGIDISAGELDTEIANFTNMMDQADAIFAMTDEIEAKAAAKALDDKLDAREFGLLSGILAPSFEPMLATAVRGALELKKFRELLEAKISMLRSPNAASYFLQAVEAYAAIDPELREKAIVEGKFEVLAEPLRLLAKAASMDPTLITLVNNPSVPNWLAPLHAMTIALVQRGTMDDVVTAIQVAAHVSQQNRFAASLAAANIIEVIASTLPEQMTQEERERILKAVRQIPSADAFMLHAAAISDTNRFADWFAIDDEWKPKPIAVLVATLSLARASNVAERWPLIWSNFVDMIGVPDDDAIIVAAVAEYMPDAMLVATFDQSQEFADKLQLASRQLLAMRKKLSRRPTKQ